MVNKQERKKDGIHCNHGSWYSSSLSPQGPLHAAGSTGKSKIPERACLRSFLSLSHCVEPFHVDPPSQLTKVMWPSIEPRIGICDGKVVTNVLTEDLVQS